jgi:predicted AAA+ superfamily ATPase
VLTQLWLLDPLPAWGPPGNPLARLAQAPKHHLADPALAARLLGLSVGGLLDGEGAPLGPQAGTMLGHLFESLVTLCVRVPAQAADANVGHLRTRNGDHEIDLVVIRDDGKVLAIEVKLATTVEDRDTTHLHWLAQHLDTTLLDAVIINAGPSAYRRPDGIGVVPLGLLAP